MRSQIVGITTWNMTRNVATSTIATRGRAPACYAAIMELPQSIEALVTELMDRISMLSERENAHYSDIMIKLDALLEKFEAKEAYENDELYREARQWVIDAGKASTSFLQRKFQIGYARAAALMDLLEENGVIGPANGALPRDSIIDQIDNDDDRDGDAQQKDADELYKAAAAIALEAGKVSSSRLQEKLDVGYARAMRLIDMLIDGNVIADEAEHIVLHHPN